MGQQCCKAQDVDVVPQNHGPLVIVQRNRPDLSEARRASVPSRASHQNMHNVNAAPHAAETRPFSELLALHTQHVGTVASSPLTVNFLASQYGHPNSDSHPRATAGGLQTFSHSNSTGRLARPTAPLSTSGNGFSSPSTTDPRAEEGASRTGSSFDNSSSDQFDDFGPSGTVYTDFDPSGQSQSSSGQPTRVLMHDAVAPTAPRSRAFGVVRCSSKKSRTASNPMVVRASRRFDPQE